MKQTLLLQRRHRNELPPIPQYLILYLKNQYLLSILIGLLGIQVSQAQSPTVTVLSPARNLLNAVANTNVALTFSQPMSSSATTLGALRVFSAQRGGQRRNGAGGITSASGNTLTFAPTTNFRPGETLFTTVTPSAQSSEGVNLARGHVHQFTVGVGGTGRGNFTPPATNPNPSVGSGARSVATGDVDGDGDLDFVQANFGNNTVSVRLNNGTGNFTPPATNPNPSTGPSPYCVVLGDVDGDGDLDFVTANFGASSASVRLNNGTGNFTPPAINPNPAVGSSSPYFITLGDVDGDGDLDLLTANQGANTVSVRLNDGTGNFTPPAINPNPSVGVSPFSLVLGDVDGDGDLDLLTANNSGNTVSVRLNDGTGNFTPPAVNPNPSVGSSPYGVVLGDVDGDGDLDFVATSSGTNTVSVRLNNGTGNFTPPAINPNPSVKNTPVSIALGDMDGDGDLDLVTACGVPNNNVSVRLNDGTGNFTPPATNPDPSVGTAPISVALGDVDGDNDLDLLTSNTGNATVSVRLNQPSPAPTITGLVASPNPVCVGSPITFTATVSNVSGSYTYTLTNGSSTSITGATSSTAFSQNLTAVGGSGNQSFTLTVSNNGQSNTATTGLTVNSLPSVSITASPSLNISSGQTTTLTAAGASTYKWSSGQTTPSLSVSLTGPYSVTGTSAAGCSRVTSVSVTVNLILPTIASLAPTANEVCVGSLVTFTATVGNVSDSYAYTLTNGSSTSITGTTSSTAFSQDLTTSGSGTQTFTLIVSDNGQSNTATTTLTVSALVVAAAQASSASALVGTTLSLSASGGTSYLWSAPPGATLSSTTNPVVSATLTSPGTQTFSVLVSTGSCSQTASVSVSASYQTIDLMPTALIDNLNFSLAQVGVARDFIVNINEVSNQPSRGPISFKIAKLTAFTITYPTSSGTSNVNGGMANTNGSWNFSEDDDYITVQTSTTFTGFSNQLVGFRIARLGGIPINTVQSINITIVPNAGSENNFANNVAVLSVTAN